MERLKEELELIGSLVSDEVAMPERHRFFVEGLLEIARVYFAEEEGYSKEIEDIIRIGMIRDNNTRFPIDPELVAKSVSREDYTKHTYGQVVKRWREVRGFNLSTFANNAGLPKGYISMLEKDAIKQNIGDINAIKLANGLAINMLYIRLKVLPDIG